MGSHLILSAWAARFELCGGSSMHAASATLPKAKTSSAAWAAAAQAASVPAQPLAVGSALAQAVAQLAGQRCRWWRVVAALAAVQAPRREDGSRHALLPGLDHAFSDSEGRVPQAVSQEIAAWLRERLR